MIIWSDYGSVPFPPFFFFLFPKMRTRELCLNGQSPQQPEAADSLVFVPHSSIEYTAYWITRGFNGPWILRQFGVDLTLGCRTVPRGWPEDMPPVTLIDRSGY